MGICQGLFLRLRCPPKKKTWHEPTLINSPLSWTFSIPPPSPCPYFAHPLEKLGSFFILPWGNVKGGGNPYFLFFGHMLTFLLSRSGHRGTSSAPGACRALFIGVVGFFCVLVLLGILELGFFVRTSSPQGV